MIWIWVGMVSLTCLSADNMTEAGDVSAEVGEWGWWEDGMMG